MNCYDFESHDGVEAKIFARSPNHAAQIFMAWWMVTRGDILPPIKVTPGDSVGTQAHLQEARFLNVAGIGRYNPHNGWVIYPPERFEELT